MGRLWSSGFELNSVTGGVEFTTPFQSPPSINTTTARTGTDSVEASTSTTRKGVQQAFSTTSAQSGYFIRFYFQIVSAPNNTQELITLTQYNSGATKKVSIRVTSARVLQLWNEEDILQIGSDSAVLATNRWYRIELGADTTTLASTTVEGRIDGTSFASGSANLAGGFGQTVIGAGVTSATTADFLFDDIAINDSTGSFQNTWPGAGEIRHLNPSAVGDSTAWTKGGSTTRSTNWEGVNDITTLSKTTPNDAVDFNSSNTLNQEDLFNIEDTPVGIQSSDTINLVQVGVRFNGVGASANASFKLEIEASAGGTIEQSATITPPNTSWRTHISATTGDAFPYALTLYDLPGASTTAWKKTDLDAAQIGYKLTATSTNAAQISTIWLLVDSTPGTTLDIDSASNSGEGTSVSTKSYTHTIASSGGNKIVVVGTQTRNNTANTNLPVTGITYNGVAMTKIRSDQYNSTGWLQTELWYLVNPPNGASTVAVTWTGSNDIVSFGTVVLVSAAQTGQTDANAGSNATAQASPVTTSVTTVTDLDWIIDSLFSKIGTAIVAGTGQTELMNLAVNAAGDRASMSRKGPITPAASSSMQWTYTGSDDYAQSVVAIKPFSAGGGGGSIVSLGYRSLLGIGI